MSLKDGNKKMSKSDPSDLSRINLNDSKDEIINKIKKAKTDTQPLPDDEKNLRDIAKTTEGKFYRASNNKSLEKEDGKDDQFLKIVKNITSKGFVRSNYEEKLVDLSDVRINLKSKS